MTRISTPQAHQRALNAAGQCARLSAALNGSVTADGLAAAETARQRAMAELQALGGLLRTARAKHREQEREAARDRAIIERDKPMLEIYA